MEEMLVRGLVEVVVGLRGGDCLGGDEGGRG